MVNYGAAFKLPFSNWGRFGALFLLTLIISVLSESTSVVSSISKNTLVGVALKLFVAELMLFFVMIFFSLIATGYSLRIVKSATQGKNEFPSFEKFFSMIVPGIKYFIAILIYIVPVLLIAFAMGFVSFFAAAAAGMVILILTVLAWLVLAAYILPMLMAHFAHEGRFSAFFELRKVLKYAFTSSYFVPWLAAVGYSIALFIPYFIILIPMTIISIANPFAALLTAPVSALYSTILTPTVSNLYGQAYYDVKSGEKAKGTVARLHVARKK